MNREAQGHVNYPVLKRPYYFEPSLRKRLLTSVFFGGFVFAFLFIFRPFGLGSVFPQGLPVIAGYGIVTISVMALLNLLALAAPSFFREENWTVGREIAWVLLNIVLIALVNAWYSVVAGVTPPGNIQLLRFAGYTLAVGLIPVSVLVIVKENLLARKFSMASEKINNVFSQPPEPELPVLIRINAGGTEILEIDSDKFYYIRSAGNYVEVHFMENGTPSRRVLRSTLKLVIASINHPRIIRCHKSFLVNLDKVDEVTGNAQGYSLHLRDVNFQVPVSRQLNDRIKELLTVGHQIFPDSPN